MILEAGSGVVNVDMLPQAIGPWTGVFRPLLALIRLPRGGPAKPLCPMWLGHDEALKSHLEALAAELGRLADRLAGSGTPPTSDGEQIAARLASLESRLTREPRSRGARVRVDALHRLAVVAEDEGWLDAGEAIMLRRLAFRVAFYLRRRDSTRP